MPTRCTTQWEDCVQEQLADTSEQLVRFPSGGQPVYLLEGQLHLPPDQHAEAGYPGVILCHPQPAGSSMDDPLVRRLAADLATAGLATLRFNFRGVGHSQGQQSDGRLEPLDLAGAMEYLLCQPGVDPEKLAMIGHAFGGLMALTYAEHDPRVRLVVAISPPTFRIAPGLGAFERPRLFVTGEYDEVSPRHKLEPWIAQLSGARHLSVISGARHLMSGHEALASSAIVKYVTRWAATPGV